MATLRDDLRALSRRLPKGSIFTWFADPERFRFDTIAIPQGSRGGGTEFLAAVLAVLDRRGMPSALTAESTDERGDPGDFELARWYARFGFELDGLSGIGTVAMRRGVRPFRDGAASVLEDYREARRNDLGWDAYRRWREEAGRAATTGPKP